MQGFLQDRTLMQWRWIRERIVTLVEVLGTWPVTVGTEGEEDRWRGGEWNMGEEGSRRFTIKKTI